MVGRNAPGRGFYVCPRPGCAALLVRGLRRWFSKEEAEKAIDRVTEALERGQPGGVGSSR